MPEQSRPSAAGIESTYKAREVEGFLDVHFYRKAGFILARAAAALGLSPSAVTFAGGLLGICAGHFYFYPRLSLNVVGMLLQITSNIFDNADGQLARLTGKQSRTGRILDGYIDHLVWLSIYVHLIWRCAAHPWHPAVLIIGIMAAFSHTLQGAAADYYRTTYLYFRKGSDRLDDFAELAEEYRRASWRTPGSKFLLLLHRNYTRQQEMLSPRLHDLRQRAALIGSQAFSLFLERARPQFKLWSLLMTNTRMLILFISLFVARPDLYFWIEVVALNLLLIWLLFRQERLAAELPGPMQVQAARV